MSMGRGHQPIDDRPQTCRNRLRDEGQAYPRSGCGHCSDGGLRATLYEGAQSFLTLNKRPCWLHTWAQDLKEKKGHGKAVIALARKIAMILYVLWIERRPFRWDDQPVV